MPFNLMVVNFKSFTNDPFSLCWCCTTSFPLFLSIDRKPMLPQSNKWIFIIYLLLLAADCDRIFISKSLNGSYGTASGTFEGPTLPRWPPLSTASLAANESTTVATADASTPEPHARQCIYTFIAGENERIRLSFTKFALRSEAPE